jgi:hypothetical protein
MSAWHAAGREPTFYPVQQLLKQTQCARQQKKGTLTKGRTLIRCLLAMLNVALMQLAP